MGRKSKARRPLAAALSWRQGEEEAPKVIARGEGKVAEKIVEVALSAGVPVRPDEALAQVLVQLDVGQVIPAALYQAVAEILAAVIAADSRS